LAATAIEVAINAVAVARLLAANAVVAAAIAAVEVVLVVNAVVAAAVVAVVGAKLGDLVPLLRKRGRF
jgi:hypothetical protein